MALSGVTASWPILTINALGRVDLPRCPASLAGLRDMQTLALLKYCNGVPQPMGVTSRTESVYIWAASYEGKQSVKCLRYLRLSSIG